MQLSARIIGYVQIKPPKMLQNAYPSLYHIYGYKELADEVGSRCVQKLKRCATYQDLEWKKSGKGICIKTSKTFVAILWIIFSWITIFMTSLGSLNLIIEEGNKDT